MSEAQDQETVKTYVPTSQKETWKEHADRLEMSQSEFVRSMVQAGRKGFVPATEKASSGTTNPRGNGLETRVLELLANDTYDWDALLAAVTDDVESRLEETLDELQATNRVQYSGRAGGYTLVEGRDGH